jgi:hypothetical protein
VSENEKTPPTPSGDGTEPGRSVATDSQALPGGAVGGVSPSGQAGANGAPTPVGGMPVAHGTPTPAAGAPMANGGSGNGSPAGPVSGGTAAPAPSPGSPAPQPPSPTRRSTGRPEAGAAPETSSQAIPASGELPTQRPAEQGAAPDAGPSSDGSPPPWRRVPGDETPTRQTRPPAPAPQAPTVADSLLSEAPTAYLDRNAAGMPPAAPAAPLLGGQGQPEGSDGRPEAPPVRSRAPRQALLQVKRFDPWSVLKLALVLAVVLFFIWLVAVGVLYGVLDGIGVWDRLNGTYADLVSGETRTGSSLISAGRVFGLAAVVGAINSLLFAVAMTVGAFVYNVSADLVGGVEVTLSERD